MVYLLVTSTVFEKLILRIYFSLKNPDILFEIDKFRQCNPQANLIFNLETFPLGCGGGRGAVIKLKWEQTFKRATHAFRYMYLCVLIRGEISFNTAGCSSLILGIILKKLHFKTLSRKLGKHVNLFYLNKNYFKVKQKKNHAF